MKTKPLNLLLADDDTDDCIFFKEALDEIPVDVNLTIVTDGVELTHLLTDPDYILPDALFLDLNMRKKTGFQCLEEIRSNSKLDDIRIIIYSTCSDVETANEVHRLGADYYICKPGNFCKLKDVIHEALLLLGDSTIAAEEKENFIIISKF